MKAIITGASSGIGRDMTHVLVSMGYTVVGVARRENRLEELKQKHGDKFIPVALDISDLGNCRKLYEMFSDDDIDIFINNAGFGYFGSFFDTDMQRELDMIDLNIKSLHILTRLFSQKLLSQGHGRILNVSSSAGFMMGPKLSTYYATKAYVLRLSEAIDEEIRHRNKNLSVSVLCPGPVRTEFDSVADVSFSLKGMSSEKVAKYAIKKLLKGKRIIIPGFSTKLLVFSSRFAPSRLLSKITYKIQSQKGK